jgi:hypothetical protein
MNSEYKTRGIAGIAVIAVIARDRENQDSPRRRGVPEVVIEQFVLREGAALIPRDYGD